MPRTSPSAPGAKSNAPPSASPKASLKGSIHLGPLITPRFLPGPVSWLLTMAIHVAIHTQRGRMAVDMGRCGEDTGSPLNQPPTSSSNSDQHETPTRKSPGLWLQDKNMRAVRVVLVYSEVKSSQELPPKYIRTIQGPKYISALK